MKKMNFKKAQIITDELFAPLPPVNVFHKECEKSDYIPDKKYENKHILFRKKFTLDTVESTLVRISADDYYKLYINGKFVTQGPAPSYNFAYFYNEIDVTEYLNVGENIIAVHTYYQGLINRVWVSGDLRHMLVCEIESNGDIVVATGEDWRCAPHTGYYFCGKNYGYDTGFCEGYDSNCAEIGFEKNDFDDSAWKNAKIKENCYYRFVKQPTRQLDIYTEPPKILEKTESGFFVDLGKEIVGYITFEASGKKGDKIIIKSGEELTDDGSVRYDMRCNCVYKEEFVLGDGLCAYNQYDYKAFRYIELDLPDGTTLLKDSFKVVVRHYPYEAAIECPYDDEKIRAVWELCADTIKYGMQEVLVDCPTREKGQYLGDGTITSIAHTILTGDATYMKKTLMDFANTSFISKGIMAVSTSSLMQEIADYSLQYPLQVLWLYNYTKDKEFLAKMHEYVKNVCDYFAYYERSDGLLDEVSDKWNLIDWPANLRDNYDFELTKPIGKGVINVINAFYYGALVAYEKICDELGLSCERKSEKVKNSFVKAFYDSETGLFTDSETSKHSSLHANVLPLLFDMRVQSNDKLCDFIEQKGLHTCGVYIAMFYLTALKNHRGKESILPHITSDKTWGKMLAQDATTCFEAWGKEDKQNTSLFHPWATAPIIALTDTVFPF